MSLLNQVKFVKPAVSKNDVIQSYRTFKIAERRITAFDGVIAMSAPIAFDLTLNPDAVAFEKAISACGRDPVPVFTLKKNGDLHVRSGMFSTTVKSSNESFPFDFPSGVSVCPAQDLMPTFKRLLPFIGENETRPWTTGLLFSEECAYATNNIVMVEEWTGFKVEEPILIPKRTIKELVRIDEEPIEIITTKSSIVFRFGEGRWLFSRLLDAKWPDVVSKLNKFENNGEEIESEFWEACEELLPFTDDALRSVYFHKDYISNRPAGDDSGTRLEIPCPPTGRLNLEKLLLLKNLNVKINFAEFPKTIFFHGDHLRGVIAPLAMPK